MWPKEVFCFFHFTVKASSCGCLFFFLCLFLLFPLVQMNMVWEPNEDWWRVGLGYTSPLRVFWTSHCPDLDVKTIRWPAYSRNLQRSRDFYQLPEFGLVTCSNSVDMFFIWWLRIEEIKFKWPPLFRDVTIGVRDMFYLISCFVFIFANLELILSLYGCKVSILPLSPPAWHTPLWCPDSCVGMGVYDLSLDVTGFKSHQISRTHVWRHGFPDVPV